MPAIEEAAGVAGVLMIVIHEDADITTLGSVSASNWWSEQSEDLQFGLISACMGRAYGMAMKYLPRNNIQ